MTVEVGQIEWVSEPNNTVVHLYLIKIDICG